MKLKLKWYMYKLFWLFYYIEILFTGRSSLLVFVVTLISLIKGLNGDNNGIFSGFKLFQARPESDHHRKVLTQLDDNIPEDAVDFWSEGIEESKYLLTIQFLCCKMLKNFG